MNTNQSWLLVEFLLWLLYNPNILYIILFSPGSDEDASELSQNLPPTPQKEGEKEGEDGELKKQEMLVQYLRDTETFALQVERAISVINSMLYWKTTSGRRPTYSNVHFNIIYQFTQERIFSPLTTEVFGFSGPRGCAVLCDSVRVQCCQLCQWGEEDVASGLVN